jgi:hypothetical protein
MSTFSDMIAQKNSSDKRDLRAENPAAYDRARRVELSAAWRARAQQHAVDGLAVKEIADALARKSNPTAHIEEGTCLDRNVPPARPYLATARTELGPSAGAYFANKLRVTGSLGQHAALCPYADYLRKGGEA